MLIADGDPTRRLGETEFDDHLQTVVHDWVLAPGVRRLLLVPPDHTRLHSRAGLIVARLWQRLSPRVQIDILPATGTHVAMSPQQFQDMFGAHIPFERMIPHGWRHAVDKIGQFDAAEMEEWSHGRLARALSVEIARPILAGGYDLILSIGQVVPHEVIGFANHTKNICIGTGGADMIHMTHFLGAIANMERVMGRVDTPVRQLVDAAFDRFVRPRADIRFLLTVVEDMPEGSIVRGFFAGADRDAFVAAAELSRQVNLVQIDHPLSRCVVTLDPGEFRSTWLGNKAIYRSRMAMADGGELFVVAPGVARFGEDPLIDALIRRHGYRGTAATLAAIDADTELADNLAAAAHLIHGSSEGRFQITYCTDDQLPAQAINAVGYHHCPIAKANQLFAPEGKKNGWHRDRDGIPYFLIRNPGLGLWTTPELLTDRNP